METWLWILVAMPFLAGGALFVWELIALDRGRAETESRPADPGTDDLDAAVRRRARQHAEPARPAADEYAWEDRPLSARRNVGAGTCPPPRRGGPVADLEPVAPDRRPG